MCLSVMIMVKTAPFGWQRANDECNEAGWFRNLLGLRKPLTRHLLSGTSQVAQVSHAFLLKPRLAFQPCLISIETLSAVSCNVEPNYAQCRGAGV
jgi:hypothetical protein